MVSPANRELLSVYDRAIRDPFFVGYWWERYRLANGLTEEQLADGIGLPIGNLDRLLVCRHPRPDHFIDDVTQIAAYVECDPGDLADLIEAASLDD